MSVPACCTVKLPAACLAPSRRTQRDHGPGHERRDGDYTPTSARIGRRPELVPAVAECNGLIAGSVKRGGGNTFRIYRVAMPCLSGACRLVESTSAGFLPHRAFAAGFVSSPLAVSAPALLDIRDALPLLPRPAPVCDCSSPSSQTAAWPDPYQPAVRATVANTALTQTEVGTIKAGTTSFATIKTSRSRSRWRRWRMRMAAMLVRPRQ